MNLGVIFFTGLTIGGLSCLAVQGGLLASIISLQEKEKPSNSKYRAVFATAVFLLAKLIAHAILGFVLGAFGGALNISDQAQIIMLLAAGIYMILVALNLLQIHPIFRYVVIQPPRSLSKLIKHQSRSKEAFAPALLGALTVFIPCGTTLAMEALAISSANPWQGAAIMTAFTIGTVPLFFGVGFVTSLLGGAMQSKFLKLAAVAVLYLGFTSVRGSMVALGMPLSYPAVQGISQTPVNQANEEKLYDEEPLQQTIEIKVTASGYSPNRIQVRRGVPVTLKLIGVDAYSCAAAFRIPSLGIKKNLQANETQVVTFTPEKSGKIPFSCSMGMYSGVIEVI
jgi:sulfite exporter TauE/SafE